MKKKLFLLSICIIIITLTSCSNDSESSSSNDSTKLIISAAISLTDALDEIKEIYEKDNNVELTFNLGGSGTLAQQIQQGAPVDVFISANDHWMDILEKETLIEIDSRSNVTGNRLALISHESTELTEQSVVDILTANIDKIAIGNPKSVPAGKYTEQTLHHLNMWDSLKDHLVFAKDVRQVLTYVETGNTDIGFVYESDALTSDTITILAIVDHDLHDPISYPGAVLSNSNHLNEARKFLTFLQSDMAQNTFESYGFTKDDYSDRY